MAGGRGVTDREPRFSDPVEPPPEGTAWTVLHLLRWSTGYLRDKGVPEARLDAEYLLARAMETDRLHLYLHYDRPVEPSELERFRPFLLERARRKPLQYILGRSAFRDLELNVDRRALIPRPETEELVDAVLERAGAWDRGDLRALDVGTGTGAIALSLAQEGLFAHVLATDISRAALELAAENAMAVGLDGKVEFREGAGFGPVADGERFEIVVSNPPYVTEAEFEGLQPEVRDWEPRSALVAGADGLDVIRELVAGAGGLLRPGGLLALEFGSEQADPVRELIRGAGGFEEPEILRDLSRHERIVVAARRGERDDETAAGETRGGMTRTSTKVRSDVKD